MTSRAAVQLHDARAAHALREILVGRADDHALDARIPRPPRPPPRPAHRPPRTRPSARPTTPSAASASSSSGNCDEQIRLDARAGLVAGPELVAERLDDVVGRDADVRRAAR